MDKQTKIIIAVSSVVVLGGVVALYLYSKPKNDKTDSKKATIEDNVLLNSANSSYTPKDSFKSSDGKRTIKLNDSQMIMVKEKNLTEKDLQRMEEHQSGIFAKVLNNWWSEKTS